MERSIVNKDYRELEEKFLESCYLIDILVGGFALKEDYDRAWKFLVENDNKDKVKKWIRNKRNL